MSKLLSLINHCLADKKFYGSQKAPSIKYGDNYADMVQHYVNIKNITPSVHNEYNFKMRVIPLITGNSTVYHQNAHPTLKITFNDEPPIFVSYANVYVGSTEGTKTVDYPTGNKWFNKICKHTFEYTVRNYEYKFFIECGSIKEEIPFELYQELIKTYRDNLQKFQQEQDNAKIEARLSQYTK